ncbi:Uncharacterised protein [Mycobacteroides abscessus subsp. abscessus]|nr:Uncharacterised protein [Mycobacteroides abscessus subsp. abscessus]
MMRCAAASLPVTAPARTAASKRSAPTRGVCRSMWRRSVIDG